MFGSHLSIAGSLVNALDQATGYKMDAVQVFTKNQQQWKCKPLDGAVVRDWRARVAELAWDTGAGRMVSHASYLINLASPDQTLWEKSVELMREEIERCEALGIPFLVHHPGAFTTSTREDGLRQIASAYARLLTSTRGYRTVLCLENTVGGGSNLGRGFDELAELRALILNESPDSPARVGFCFDTCHAHAGGYDLSTAPGVAAALAEWDRACGLANIRVLHVNDSKVPAGARRDRHEHIGKGTIGDAGFAAILACPAFRDTPKILETPKGKTKGGVDWDVLNLCRLRKLAASAPAEPASAPARTSRAPARVRTRVRAG